MVIKTLSKIIVTMNNIKNDLQTHHITNIHLVDTKVKIEMSVTPWHHHKCYTNIFYNYLHFNDLLV